MTSQYDCIVDALCKYREVVLEVHKDRELTTIAMVKKQKCKYNQMRKAVGLPGLSQMIITVEKSKVSIERRRITFKLLFSVDLC